MISPPTSWLAAIDFLARCPNSQSVHGGRNVDFHGICELGPIGSYFLSLSMYNLAFHPIYCQQDLLINPATRRQPGSYVLADDDAEGVIPNHVPQNVPPSHLSLSLFDFWVPSWLTRSRSVRNINCLLAIANIEHRVTAFPQQRKPNRFQR
ncbi:hypothetical protein CONLIGDRAFT_649935 [Coniochaeta ligniaria NRRL 30616]|uniref:Uncharacterized protein n=1 Tax=Coniochaeta ligniaria NRRL 30616 TaxID=1408157 RepID=A0A1J7I640_9PEZI|nr:hypothetical protein CONLIGDRAFT_649935 [Coniochaeta ligniaria NRRL 30616]